MDSNGPDVKIRGTASHIYDKYQVLARDAQSSGDRIGAENYLQHAEHYFRLIQASQPTQQAGDGQGRQQPSNGQRPAEEAAEAASAAARDGNADVKANAGSAQEGATKEGATKEGASEEGGQARRKAGGRRRRPRAETNGSGGTQTSSGSGAEAGASQRSGEDRSGEPSNAAAESEPEGATTA